MAEEIRIEEPDEYVPDAPDLDTREALRYFAESVEAMAQRYDDEDTAREALIDAIFFADIASEGLPERWSV